MNYCEYGPWCYHLNVLEFIISTLDMYARARLSLARIFNIA
jgi:hypothetical protein